MSRSGYYEGDDDDDWAANSWRGTVARAMRGKRGQAFLLDLIASLEQVGLHDGDEAVESVWITPAQALAEADAGARVLVFVTRLNLEKLARFATVGQALFFHPVAREAA